MAEAEYSRRCRLIEESAEWLLKAGDPDLFGTVTIDPKRGWVALPPHTRRKRSPWDKGDPPGIQREEVFVRRFRESVTAADEVLRSRLEWVLGVEPFYGGGLHGHVLVYAGGLQGNEIKALWSGWYKKNGFCLFSEPKKSLSVREYVSKYLVKKGDVGGLHFSDGWSTRTPVRQGVLT